MIALVFVGMSVFFVIFAFGFTDALTTPLDTGEPDLIGFPGAADPIGPDVGAVDSAGSLAAGVFKMIGLCGVPFALVGCYLLLRIWREAAWLDGTVLTRRGAFLSRAVDLSTAEIAMGGINYSQHHDHGTHHQRSTVRVPALVATDQRSGRITKLPLRGQGLDLLPSGQLAALADALDQNRSAAVERARAIGAHLRSLAADPLAY
ncbi:hypothetical protein F4553_003935 [Allocatelliglobosispora scoriae]|uniref:Uncharacterized protein n=1 Tax=Allocatelliglobosispora scoriae TaxID=643052 RepID=A0A841BT27_9ACTN|nr:hypothetical protein [Allocatelliglobosispora scoriae]MBB5870556.1 hypothetical protein [Allocatelliglobosispora scoriae]